MSSNTDQNVTDGDGAPKSEQNLDPSPVQKRLWDLLSENVERGDALTHAVERALADGANPMGTKSWSKIKSSPLHRACALDLPEAIAPLLAAGADPWMENRLGLCCVEEAIRWDHAHCVRELVEHGVDLRAMPGTQKKWGIAQFQPLVFAIREGSSGVVDYLLAIGFDPNEADAKTMYLPLQLARTNPTMFLALLQAGADPNLVHATSGDTVGHLLARSRGRQDCVKSWSLVVDQLDLQKTNAAGEKVIDLALQEDNPSREVTMAYLSAIYARNVVSSLGLEVDEGNELSVDGQGLARMVNQPPGS